MPTIPSLRDQVATALRCLRLDAGLTLEQVARKTGLRKQSVHPLETGKTGALLDTIEAVATALNASLLLVALPRGSSALRSALDVVTTTPADQLPALVELLQLWAALPPIERELIMHTGSVRAHLLAPAQVAPAMVVGDPPRGVVLPLKPKGPPVSRG